MKRTNTTLSRTGFSIAFIAAISLTTMITSMCLIQRGDNVALAASQNTTIITTDNHTTAVAPNQNTVTGQLIYEAHGKIVAQKVINSGKTDGAKIQVSYSGSGKFTNGLNVKELWTFVNTHKLDGVIQGVGQGFIKTIDNIKRASEHERAAQRGDWRADKKVRRERTTGTRFEGDSDDDWH